MRLGRQHDRRLRAPRAGSSDCSGTLNAEGSSAQKNAIEEVISSFSDTCADATVNYNPTGSGAGVKQFTGGQVDFAGSDSALKADAGEVDAAAKRCAGNPAWNLPMVAGPIAVSYNVPGVDAVTLTPSVIAQIFTGKVKTWNDPAIAKLNGDAKLAEHRHQGVLPVRRVGHHGELREVPGRRGPQRLDHRAGQGLRRRRRRGSREVGRRLRRGEVDRGRHHVRRVVVREGQQARRREGRQRRRRRRA
ncbi:hypothetical protein GCM10025868_28090 [Angustibacter aerolatus]|uniref:PBP domain-containing protein n=1 Tax=Angustibacter aerolatus TaxID=1162965 RepID=A0ABQ6JKA4_9ACTN|nr:hypothetical protein GCM10025868_28090 [Angustibacter aerolatus]